jgi:LemA protein
MKPLPLFHRWKRAVVLVLATASLSACGINSVPTAQENAKAKWANVQADFQRRANLVGNLVATVKAAAEHEETTLREVTEARAKATSVQISADDLSNPAKVAQFSQAQGALSQSLGRLLVSVEAYPNLKANENFLTLQSQLEGTENRIAVSIRDYNEAVREYNTQVRTFPTMIGASIRGATVMTPYQAVTPGAEVAPKVDFGK